MTALTQMSIAPMPTTMDSISIVYLLAIFPDRASESSGWHYLLSANFNCLIQLNAQEMPSCLEGREEAMKAS